MGDRIRVDGKYFSRGLRPVAFHGVTYGTFAPREDGERYSRWDIAKLDFVAMAATGFSVVCTDTPPPDDIIDLAADWILVDLFYPDWRYVVGASRRQRRRVARDARAVAERVGRQLSGNEVVLGISVGNEIPADVVRWTGAGQVAGLIEELADAVRSEDPGQLVTCASHPMSEYRSLDSLDFLTFNVFLERQADFRRHLTRVQHLAGERPLVLGEVGYHAVDGSSGEEMQAEVLAWQLETALERGVAGACVYSWTDEWWVGDAAVEDGGSASPGGRPLTAAGLGPGLRVECQVGLGPAFPWPTMTVVIYAYNATVPIDECLRHTCSLDYPGLEIIVIDDGSTDATAAIARRHPKAQMVTIPTLA